MSKGIKRLLIIAATTVVVLGVIGLILPIILVTINPMGQIKKAKQQEQKQQISEIKVEIKDMAFGPKTITIKAGESVTFTNMDLVGHSATADDDSWDTGIISNNESSTIKFEKAGTYTYHCTPHPFMKGTIVVE